MKQVAIIGSTGSIGTQLLAVLEDLRDEFAVHALTANTNIEQLAEQISAWQPQFYSCNLENPAETIEKARFAPVERIVNDAEVDIFVFASSGYANLPHLLTALQTGKTALVANKELLVMAGAQIVNAAHQSGATLLPIDSEPVGILQCLAGEQSDLARVFLLASGGALRGYDAKKLAQVTPAEALKHPTWSMGRHITIDSATLVNKAFELAELHWFFGIPFEKVEVILHPQSHFHAMVMFADGVCKAQISPPDMRYAINYALNYPARRANKQLTCNWDIFMLGEATFEPLRAGKYPCFELAVDCIKRGGTLPATLVGANRAAVELFLAKRIKFTDIFAVVGDVVKKHAPNPAPSIAEIINATSDAYHWAQGWEA